MGAAAACVSGALAFPATAEVTVGGFMTQTVGFGDYRGGGESAESVHFDTNAEVLFTATSQTDGGLTVTARVELEGASGGDQIDENWLSIEGEFGKLTLGGEDPAVITHGYAGIAGGYGIMGYYDDTDSFTPVGANIYPVGYKDAQGIRYSTPSIGGFSAAASYQPDYADGPRGTGASNKDRAISVAGSFSNDQVTIAGGTLAFDDSTNNGNQFGFGAEFTLGTNTLYLRGDRMDDVSSANYDVRNYGVAVERAMGSLTVGLGYAQQKADFDESVTLQDLIDAGEFDESDFTDFSNAMLNVEFSTFEVTRQAVVLGAKYNLGSGVDVGAAFAWGEIEYDLEANSQATAKEDGTSFGAHLAFSF